MLIVSALLSYFKGQAGQACICASRPSWAHLMRIMGPYVALIVLLGQILGSQAAESPSCDSSAAALTALLKQQASQLPSCAQLSEDIVLRWGIKGDIITFGLQAQLPPGTAYLGIGLSELGSMKGADIFLFNSTSNGWKLVDSYAVGFGTPVADKLQDSKLLGVLQTTNGSLLAAWQRHLAPCDQEDLPISSVPLHVIWAYGDGWGYHGSKNRGGRQVSFLEQQPQQQPKPQLLTSSASYNTAVNTESSLPSDVKVLELKYPVSIPEKTTTYFIKYFKLPSNKKYHILSYEPITNSPLLHHGVVYSCEASKAAQVQKLPALGPYDRFAHDMLCEQFYMLVAPNGTAYHVPTTVGLPMGTPNSQYVALELHYNNPEHLTNQTDKGSGVRVYYTDKLRQHDMGLLTLQQPVLNIPGGQALVKSNVSVCPGSCTSRFKGPVTLLDGFFHMHGIGKSIITRRFRNGTELAPVAQLRAFDYEFQSNTRIGAEARTLQPGDTLTLQCTFDSTGRTNFTRSGPATDDEMCFHWISYYPAQGDMGMCYSFGDRPFAVCGPSMPVDLQSAFRNRSSAAAVVTQLMSDGKLLPVADPASSSKAFKEVCSPKPVL